MTSAQSFGGIGFGIKREVFFLNLEDGYFGCQVNESTDVLQLFELSKLCDGTPNCYLGSDELAKELKCTDLLSLGSSESDTVSIAAANECAGKNKNEMNAKSSNKRGTINENFLTNKDDGDMSEERMDVDKSELRRSIAKLIFEMDLDEREIESEAKRNKSLKNKKSVNGSRNLKRNCA
ncbi:unnamed protein product [Acanthoscelides obtectus]|uniref:Uncharacterized protein n=1 Tax=Acanthoscelides obtectus TaxID=200917 RepID=A0A9P0L2C0_ACAOB|nr:unnamed protein product [Acanthoscelides obtectus]CAK1620331.1 hypothetical protein AOBTE_LOCUS316 [Acanthoscelides obtectus]